MNSNSKLKLLSGYEIPVLGIGTWKLTGEKGFHSVKKAIELGYRHIDTAWAYGNHEDVGRAIKESKIPREKIFLTSKVWYLNLHYEDLLKQTEEILDKLKTDYLDLLLIHWPNRKIPLEETFAAFQKLKNEGKVKSFGVSNFTIHHLNDAIKLSTKTIPVSVNQVEFHPEFNQKNLLEFCSSKKIILTSYSPLGTGTLNKNRFLKEIGEAKGKTPSQIAFRWILQKGIVAIPKASSEEHLRENLDVFDFALNNMEMRYIDSLGSDNRLINPGFSDFNY